MVEMNFFIDNLRLNINSSIGIAVYGVSSRNGKNHMLADYK